MASDLPFIGREKELNQVKQILRDWGTSHLIAIYSTQGGIGKTRILQEIATFDSEELLEDRPFRVVPIIDFDDRLVSSRGTLQRRMVEELGNERFDPYLQHMIEWRHLEEMGVGKELLDEESAKVRSAFESCLNEITDGERIVYLLDTSDKVEGDEIWLFLYDVLSQVKNLVIILCGRNSHLVAEKYFEAVPENVIGVNLIALDPLSSNECDHYLESMQSYRLKQAFNPETVRKIKALSQGTPILLDLVIERLAMDDTFAEFLATNSEDFFKNLSQDDQTACEKMLIEYLGEERNDLEKLTLLLAHVYPLSKTMIKILLKLDNPEGVIEQAKKTVFIKQIPGERFSLHDEMRRMVDSYIWDEVDANGQQRRSYSERAVSLFRTDIRILTERIDGLPHGNSNRQINVMAERDNLIRRRDATQVELLRHLLFANTEQGVNEYIQMHSAARRANRFRLAQRLTRVVAPLYIDLSADSQYRLDIARVQLLLDSGYATAKEAKQLLLRLLAANEDMIERKGQILNLLGRSEEILGNYLRALDFELEYYATLDRPQAQVQATNYIGYIYRLIGNWKKAEDYYKRALEMAFAQPELRTDTLPNILNNLAYVICLQGNYEQAKAYCIKAIEIWEKSGTQSSLGRGYLTRAIIYRDRGKYDQAAGYFERAIKIFEKKEEPDDFRNLVRAYFNYAWSLWFEGDVMRYDHNEDPTETYKASKLYFDQARELAERYGVVSELPGILNQMSNIYWRLGEEQEARAFNQQAYQLSKQYFDIRYAIDSLVGFAEFDADKGDYSQIERYAAELKRDYEEQNYDFSLFYGRMRRIQAEGMLMKGDFSGAKTFFARGIFMIAQHGGYGLYFVDRELAHLKGFLADHLPGETVVEFAEYFREQWNDESSLPRTKAGVLMSWCDVLIIEMKMKMHGDNG